MAQEAIEQRFHVDREVLDFLAVITPGDEGGNRDEKAHERGVEGNGNTGGEFGVVGEAAGAEFTEEANQAVDSSDEAEKRADADDDLQNDEAAFEFDDFLAGARFEEVHRFFFRIFEMIIREQGQAR